VNAAERLLMARWLVKQSNVLPPPVPSPVPAPSPPPPPPTNYPGPEYVGRIGNAKTTVQLSPIEPVLDAYGAKTPQVLSSARRYQAAHPEIRFVNSVDDKTLYTPTDVIGPKVTNPWENPWNRESEDMAGYQTSSVSNLKNLVASTRPASVINDVDPEYIKNVIDHETLHQTQHGSDFLRRPIANIKGWGGWNPFWDRDLASGGNRDYHMHDAEVMARIPRLTRDYVHSGAGEFPQTPQEGEKILNYYGINRGGKFPADVPGQAYVQDAQGNETLTPLGERSRDMPHDIQNLQWQLNKLPVDDRNRAIDAIIKQMPGSVQNTAPFHSKQAMQVLGWAGKQLGGLPGLKQLARSPAPVATAAKTLTQSATSPSTSLGFRKAVNGSLLSSVGVATAKNLHNVAVSPEPVLRAIQTPSIPTRGLGGMLAALAAADTATRPMTRRALGRNLGVMGAGTAAEAAQNTLPGRIVGGINKMIPQTPSKGVQVDNVLGSAAGGYLAAHAASGVPMSRREALLSALFTGLHHDVAGAAAALPSQGMGALKTVTSMVL
jgi:hypothetical protein